MNNYILWAIVHFDKKKQEIVLNEFITEIGSTMGQILALINNDNVLCYPHLCDPLKHKIKQKSINAEEFKNLNMELETIENLRGIK